MALGSLVRTMASWLGRLLSLSLSSLKTSGASVTGSRERWGVLTELRSETRGVEFSIVTNKMLCWVLRVTWIFYFGTGKVGCKQQTSDAVL